MEPLRWGILGVASHFIKRVVTPMRRSSSADLYAIASRDGLKAREAATQFGIKTWYASYDELLRDPNVEAVFIPLPNHMHSEWIRKSADAGKHILCEKPLAMNAKDAADCIAYAQGKGVKIMEAFMYRFHPQWQRAFELVRIGEIGKVIAIHSFFGYMNTDAGNIRNILEAGGGALRDIGCYAVSISRWMFGREPERVVSLVDRDKNFGTDRHFSGIMDFGSGRSLFTASTQTWREQRVDIHGTAGSISVHLPLNVFPDTCMRITVATNVGIRDIIFEPADQYGIEIEAFSHAVRENLPVPTDPADAVENQKVLDALFLSEKSGAWVSV